MCNFILLIVFSMTKTELLNYSPILLSKYFLIGVRSSNGIVSEVNIPTDFQAETL